MESLKPYKSKEEIVHSYRITSQEHSIQIPFTNFVKYILAFPNYKLWIYYGNGKYQIWDGVKENLITAG